MPIPVASEWITDRLSAQAYKRIFQGRVHTVKYLINPGAFSCIVYHWKYHMNEIDPEEVIGLAN